MAILDLPTLQHEWFQHVDRVARRVLGVNDVSGARLARAVVHVSQLYTRERSQLADLRGDDEALCARLKFFLSRDLLKVHGPVAELASVGALPARRQLRVLDIGAGLGATSLGLARSVRALDLAERIDVTAIDIDDTALDAFTELSGGTETLPAVPIGLTTRVADLRQGLGLARAARFDVILIGLMLNELPRTSADFTASAVAQLTALTEHLVDDGVIIVIEPALRETSRALHEVRDALAQRELPPFVFAPCLGRVKGCPMLRRERDFCHERVPYVMPQKLAEIARAAGLRDTDLTYSYLTLHRARRSLRELGGAGTQFRAVSGALASKGKVELWLCGETAAPRAMRLDRHASPANEAFELAERGSVLLIQPAECGEDGERLRVTADTSATFIQHWVAPKPAVAED